MTGFELMIFVAAGLERPAAQSPLAARNRADAVIDRDEMPAPRELTQRAIFVTEGREKPIVARPGVGPIA